MVALLIIVNLLLVGVIAAVLYVAYKIEQSMEYQQFTHGSVVDLLNGIKTEVDKKGHVVDPFEVANKTNSVGAPTRHIIPRNSPDYIRNQNADKIKAGLGSYGNPE